MSVDACDACLRRAWLVESLAAHIEKVATRNGGLRSGPAPELLALDDAELVRALAPSGRQPLLERNRAVDPVACRALIEAAGCWAICRHAPGFPPGLLHARDCPPLLVGMGQEALLRGLESDGCVTIVGARRASSYGIRVAEQLGRELAAAGVLVISGMALGVDGAAHRGALERGPSLGVLGSGADVVYPRAHRAIHHDLAARGAVISERPPGATPFRWSFPARNRIMAALSALTVVVEAMPGSGSLITVELAAQLGRDIGAVPGPVTSRLSEAPNDLLREGALLVRDAADVLECLFGAGARKAAVPGPVPDAPAAAALEAVERGAVTPDAVVLESGLAAPDVAGALSWLELAGYLEITATGALSRSALPLPPDDA